MLSWFRKLCHRQSGFTLIELIVGVFVTALIVLAAAMVTTQMFKVNASSSKRVEVIRQVQNAGMWVSKDTQMAQSVNIDDPDHFFVLAWADWDTPAKYMLEYDIVNGDQLQRSYWVKQTADTDYVLDNQTIVANYVDTSLVTDESDPAFGKMRTRMEKSGRVYIFTITATIGGFTASGSPVTETRTYEILPRPSA